MGDMTSILFPVFVIFSGFVGVWSSNAGELYRGKYMGRLSSRQHKVSGEVYAVDARTVHIRGFTYDGTGPDAFFWTGFTEYTSPQGLIVPNEKGSKGVLGAYNNDDITLTLPDGLSLKDVKWLAVWCRAYEVNFGDLYIPSDLDFPQPHVIGSLSGQHGVSSGPIVVVDAQTILVPDFSYDGQAPDVHFWVGKGKLGPDGTRVGDEIGGETALMKSDKKTMVLNLPGDLTIFDIDFFGVWCRLYYVDFGHVRIPQSINVPPSLRMLGVTPQTKLNCEVLYDRLGLEVRWALAGESIVMQLVGRVEDGQYISFGLSGDESRSRMVGGDVVLAWYDRPTGRAHVVDYFIEGKGQCSGRSGVCPDSRLKAEANNVRLLSGAVINQFTMITFQRPLRAQDELDRTIRTNSSEAVIWAVGPINQRNEASYHTLRNRDDIFIDFGRQPKWNCPAPESDLSAPMSTTTLPPTFDLPNSQFTPDEKPQASKVTEESSTAVTPPPAAWRVPPILCHEPEDRVFYAQMGPTGGKRGYSAITGKIGWGIAWYINGLLVPEVYLVRGKTYTFVVEGGDNAEIPAKFHPFYITDDAEGGFQHKSPSDKRKVKVFAGYGGTGTGRLCQWQENGSQAADSFPSYGAYQRSLSLQCEDGHPGIVHWTPDANTPDTVYYQCYTHRYLGWKIHIVDSCEGDQDSSFPPPQQLLSRRGSSGIVDGEHNAPQIFSPEIPKFNDSTSSTLNVLQQRLPNHHHSPESTQPQTLFPRSQAQESQALQGLNRPLPSSGPLFHSSPSPSPYPSAQPPYPSPSPYPTAQPPYAPRILPSSRAPPLITYPLVYDSPMTLGSDQLKFILPSAGTGVTGGTARPWQGSIQTQTRHLAKRQNEGEQSPRIHEEWPSVMRKGSRKLGREIQGGPEAVERLLTSDLKHPAATKDLEKVVNLQGVSTHEYSKGQNRSQLHILTDIWSLINSSQGGDTQRT